LSTFSKFIFYFLTIQFVWFLNALGYVTNLPNEVTNALPNQLTALEVHTVEHAETKLVTWVRKSRSGRTEN